MICKQATGSARVSRVPFGIPPKGSLLFRAAAHFHKSRGKSSRRAARAFTFVEILAAMAFLGILIPAVVTAFTQANRAAVAAERTSIAVRLCENHLNELLIGNTWQSAGGGGDCGADYPGYHWDTSQTSWLGDSTNAMTELTVHVYFPVQGQEREVKLTTLVNNTLTQP